MGYKDHFWLMNKAFSKEKLIFRNDASIIGLIRWIHIFFSIKVILSTTEALFSVKNSTKSLRKIN